MASIFKRTSDGKPGGNWLACFQDLRGRFVTRSTGTTDKAAAKRIANQWEAAAALRRSGVIDSRADEINRQAARPLVGNMPEKPGHLDDYRGKLQTAGRTENYIGEIIRIITDFANDADWHRPIDIQPADAESYLVKLSNLGRSARTIQKYIRAITGFTKWMARQSRIDRDPLRSLSAPSPDGDRRLVRRFLLPAEWECLKTVLAGGLERWGMTADERLTLYWTALETGLRANELRTLRRGNLSLDSKPPFVTVTNRNDTKNRKVAKQYIGQTLAPRLARLSGPKTPTAKLFRLPPKYEMANMLRDDLSDARRKWLADSAKDPNELARRTESDFLMPIDHNQERLDFHALRHTCGAWLANQGERPQVIQAVMRHSTIKLTLDTYGHLFPDDRSGAVGKVQNLLGIAPIPLAATGTDPLGAQEMRRKDYAKEPVLGASKKGKTETSCDEKTKLEFVRIAEIPVFSGDNLLDVAKECDRVPPKKGVKALGLEPRTYGLKVSPSTPETRGNVANSEAGAPYAHQNELATEMGLQIDLLRVEIIRLILSLDYQSLLVVPDLISQLRNQPDESKTDSETDSQQPWFGQELFVMERQCLKPWLWQPLIPKNVF